MNTQSSNPNQTSTINGAQGNTPALDASTERQSQGGQAAAPARNAESADDMGSQASNKDATIRQDDLAGKSGTKAPSSN